MGNPFDLEGMAAARAEAAGEGFTFTLRGVTFSMLPISEFDYSLLELLDENLRNGLNELLGPQAEKFWEQKPKVLEVTMLRDELLRFYGGVVAGESGASPGSSRRSSRRSRPASSANTDSA